MPTYTLCREYVVSQSVLGQFFEWVTTLGIEDCVRLDLDFCPGSSLDSTPPSPPADIWLDNVSNISATGLSLPSQDPLPLSCDALAPSTSSLFTNPSVGTPDPSSAINANGHDYATPAPATLDTVVTAPPSSPAPRKPLQKCNKAIQVEAFFVISLFSVRLFASYVWELCLEAAIWCN